MATFVRLSEATSLAIDAMAFMAQEKDRKVPVKEIAAKLGKSENHLAKVILRLSKARLLNCTRGQQGGCTLSRDPADITLEQIYEIMEGPMDTNYCLFDKPACDGITCMISKQIHQIEDLMTNYFKTTSVQNLLEARTAAEEKNCRACFI